VPGREHVSTREFHAGRERAPHLEQDAHRPRLYAARDMVRLAVGYLREDAPSDYAPLLVDLGCGDGGLLQLLRDGRVSIIGIDFQPSNREGWRERRVPAIAGDFVEMLLSGRCSIHGSTLPDAEIYVMTEVLEHLAEPGEVLHRLAQRPRARYLVCSSPASETIRTADACHAWAWSIGAYRALLHWSGWDPLVHRTVKAPGTDMVFQVVLAERINSRA